MSCAAVCAFTADTKLTTTFVRSSTEETISSSPLVTSPILDAELIPPAATDAGAFIVVFDFFRYSFLSSLLRYCPVSGLTPVCAALKNVSASNFLGAAEIPGKFVNVPPFDEERPPPGNCGCCFIVISLLPEPSILATEDPFSMFNAFGLSTDCCFPDDNNFCFPGGRAFCNSFTTTGTTSSGGAFLFFNSCSFFHKSWTLLQKLSPDTDVGVRKPCAISVLLLLAVV